MPGAPPITTMSRRSAPSALPGLRTAHRAKAAALTARYHTAMRAIL